ncbi:hypothetical protein [Trujillonella endophytica]|uniref:Acyl-CoA thioesterase n=1 Tax=Trujillonella endophytica TaxID=673521 RepID=A0A1H8PGJ5_9ACTN|nr:hypothetical protein [Trujillella endophytica]SEO40847.1 hypothetical protein SAMN05660991_00160 [Trujillella endophytica]
MGFGTEVTITGPWRSPAQMLVEQEVRAGERSVHDPATAGALGLAGAPIEGPTHVSQFDPLAVVLWGDRWFTSGCLGAHFQTMVVEGQQVQAALTADAGPEARAARIAATRDDGTPVLVGSASVGEPAADGEVRGRLGRVSDPGELFILDRLEVGAVATDPEPVRIRRRERHGPLYPFSLDDKLARITEPHPWYTDEGAATSPWGRAIVPMEMISVLAHQRPVPWPVRSPSTALFLDLEVRLLAGPVFVEHDYRLEHRLEKVGQSRRTESYWTSTRILDAGTGEVVATTLLHVGVFKDSYAGHPDAAAGRA